MSGHGEHESHAGITAEIRARAGAWMDDKMKQNDERLADRLEAAHKRECAKIEADALAVGGIVEAARKRERGDCAKLREALETVLKTIRGVINSTISPRSNTVFDCRDKLSAALAAPPRNCDVGSVDEQAQRFYNFCTEHSSAIQGMCDYKCPCIDSGDKCHCLCKWAQMPYEEGDDYVKARSDYQTADEAARHYRLLHKALTRFNNGVDPLAEGGAK